MFQSSRFALLSLLGWHKRSLLTQGFAVELLFFIAYFSRCTITNWSQYVQPFRARGYQPDRLHQHQPVQPIRRSDGIRFLGRETDDPRVVNTVDLLIGLIPCAR